MEKVLYKSCHNGVGGEGMFRPIEYDPSLSYIFSSSNHPCLLSDRRDVIFQWLSS